MPYAKYIDYRIESDEKGQGVLIVRSKQDDRLIFQAPIKKQSWMFFTLLREGVFYAKPLQILPKCVILIDACAGAGVSRAAYLPCAKRTCYQKGLLCIRSITMSEFLASIHPIAVCLIVCFAKIANGGSEFLGTLAWKNITKSRSNSRSTRARWSLQHLHGNRL